MNIVTFQSKLSSTDKHYPKYQNGRIILTNVNSIILQVYNNKDYKVVKGFNIDVKYPFDKQFRYGRIYYHKKLDRVGILLLYKDDNSFNFKRKNSYFSRYIYQVSKGMIPDDLHVDHKNGNRLDDQITNLTGVTELHNYQKSLYGRYWLPKYNKKFNTNYTEQDLLDIYLLNKVINYTLSIRDKDLKEHKSNYRKTYNVKNKQQISNYNKEYGKLHYQENKNFINKRKWLSVKINNLIHERWTIELGKTIIKTIEELLELYKITIQEIVKGLDVTKYKIKTINMLNRIVIIYSENQNKLSDI